MRFEVDQIDRVIHVKHKDEVISFQYSVWTVLNSNTTEVIFGPTNEYVATLDEETQDSMFALYKQAETIFSDTAKIKYLKQTITEVNQKLALLIKFDHLHAWCTANADFFQDPPQPAMTGKNPPEMTYSLQEMFDLRVACVGIKILTPIIGSFVVSTKDEVQTAQKERVTGEIVTKTAMAKWPPMKRFSQYIAALAHRRQSTVPMPLRFGAAKADLDKYLMGMSIVRRFAIARLRSSDDGSIIAYVYTFLEDKLRNLNKDNWNHKFANSDSSSGAESVGYADHHRISEEVTKDYVIAAESYLADYPVVAQHLGYDPTLVPEIEENIRTIRSRIMAYHIVPEIHYLLTGLIIKDIIDPRSLMVIESKDALVAIIATAAAVYSRLGHRNIAELLMSRREERDPGMMTTGGSKLVISRLTHALEAELSSCYPYVLEADVKTNTNPGKRSIEGLVKSVLTYDWPDVQELNGIRISIATCLIMAAKQTAQQ